MNSMCRCYIPPSIQTPRESLAHFSFSVYWFIAIYLTHIAVRNVAAGLVLMPKLMSATVSTSSVSADIVILKYCIMMTTSNGDSTTTWEKKYEERNMGNPCNNTGIQG